MPYSDKAPDIFNNNLLEYVEPQTKQHSLFRIKDQTGYSTEKPIYFLMSHYLFEWLSCGYYVIYTKRHTQRHHDEIAFTDFDAW